MKTRLFFKHYLFYGLILIDFDGVDSKVVIMLVFIEGSLFLHLLVVFFKLFSLWTNPCSPGLYRFLGSYYVSI